VRGSRKSVRLVKLVARSTASHVGCGRHVPDCTQTVRVKTGELIELLGWCVPAECFSWTFVQLGSDLIELACDEGSEIGAVGWLFPEQPVCVLVCVALPG